MGSEVGEATRTTVNQRNKVIKGHLVQCFNEYYR